MGAALSYYTAFSLAPLIVFVLSLATLVVKKKDASKYIVDEVTSVMGDSGGKAVRDILDHAGTTHAVSWSTAISFIVLLIGASGAFGELQDSLNQIWEVPPQKHPFLAMFKERALSFAMVFVLGFFMLVSLVLSAVIEILSKAVVDQFPTVGLEVANTLISFVVFSALFCVIFRLLPEVPLKWSDVWPGAIFSAALFIVGKFLLGSLYFFQQHVVFPLWRGGIFHRHSRLGLLLGPDSLHGSGILPRLHDEIWVVARQDRQARQGRSHGQSPLSSWRNTKRWRRDLARPRRSRRFAISFSAWGRIVRTSRKVRKPGSV